DVLVFSMLFLNVMAPLGEMHRVPDEGHESSLRVKDLLDLLAEPEDRSFATPAGRRPCFTPSAPAIVIRNLHLDYASGAGELLSALAGVSLEIAHGETIGLAGLSGSGKS